VKKLIAGLALLLAACAPTVDVPVQEARWFVRALYTTTGTIFCSTVILRPGLAVTAGHCVRGESLAFLSAQSPAGILLARGDDRLDYALLNFTGPTAACPCVRLAEREAEVDERVYVIGFPLGIAQVLTEGRSQGVVDNPSMPYGRRLVLTAQVAGGNSGGGVFVYRDGEFQLVGLLVEASGHLSFAIPLADLRPFIESRNSL
jgi:S1-C subfamily serine protease